MNEQFGKCLKICKLELEDDVTFSFRSIGEIREGDVYTGYRVSLSANYPPMAVPLKLDITTGRQDYTKEIEYQFKLLLEDKVFWCLHIIWKQLWRKNWRQSYPE